MQEELDKLLEEVRDWGCSCDLLVGYSCEHNDIKTKIEEFVKKYCHEQPR